MNVSITSMMNERLNLHQVPYGTMQQHIYFDITRKTRLPIVILFGVRLIDVKRLPT